MNRTTKLLIMGLLTTVSAFLQRCTNGWDTFYEGVVDGKKYKVQERVVRGYFSSASRMEYRLRYGNLPYLPVSPNTTNWDVVYSTDIFGNAPFDYITTKDIVYSNSDIDTERVGARTFLYLLPDDVNEKEYGEYVQFFKSSEWQKADSILIDMTEKGAPFPHIVGLVHGDPSRYTQDFKGMYLGQEYIFRIENDGRVRLVDNLGEVGTGLSPKVQMPSKIIYFLSPSGGITLEELKTFKNDQGQSPFEVFKFLSMTNLQ